MGLCPDCQEEGETISYIGASKADIVDDLETKEQPETDEDNSDSDTYNEETLVCDLCESEYVLDEYR